MGRLRGKHHFLWTTIFFIGLWLLFGIYLKKDYFTITQVIAAIPISFFPDVDKNFLVMGHRNWFSHSILLWIIIYIYNPYFIFLILMLGIGFHCLLDINFEKERQKGYYTIKWFGYSLKTSKWHYKGLNGKNSTIWLFLNFFIALSLFIYVIGAN